MTLWNRLRKEENGTTTAEYAMLTCMVSLSALAATVALAIKFLTLFIS